ncbi:MAG: peptide ABC transporter substrate-binding protein [Opitutaceae bacterium]|nr:peptide ABC transporter substrate-binding protein [Opitutaceae bacterium]
MMTLFLRVATPVTAATLTCATLLVAGCGRRETTVESGLRTQTLHVGNQSEPPDLDPHTNNSSIVGYIHDALLEGLVRLAKDGATVLPGVAERWEISPDGRTYTFHLRTGAVWSNGDPVTAEDFVAGFRRFLDPKLGCEAANFLFSVERARDFLEGRTKDFADVGIKAPDARTVVFRLAFRAPYFLALLTDSHLRPLHRPSLEKFGGVDRRGGKWTQPGNFVTNGPFVLTEWKPHTVIVVTKNSRYWDAARVGLEAIRFYPTEDSAAEERAYRAGQLHVTMEVPQSKIEAYARSVPSELRSAPVLRSNFVSFSTQRPPFNDARVRRAFALAIDRERLAASVLKGRGEPAFSYVRPGTGGYAFPPFHRFDPAEARKLLAEAGFPGGAGFPKVDYAVGSRNQDNLAVAQALQEMWHQTLGVKVGIASMEFKVWLDVLRTKTFAFTADNWNMGINDPSEMLALGVTGDPNNDAGWSDPRYDAAFAAVNSAPDEPARRAAIARCEQLIAEEAPYAPVYFSIQNRLVHPTVVGWHNNPLQKTDWTALSLARPK